MEKLLEQCLDLTVWIYGLKWVCGLNEGLELDTSLVLYK